MPAPWKVIAAAATAFAGTVGLLVYAAGESMNRGAVSAVRRRRVALIGDSYAVGLGPELAKVMPDFVGYRGIVGSSPAQWSSGEADVWRWLRDLGPTTVLVSLGVNGGAVSTADMHAVVSAVHGLGARAVWVEPPAGVTAPGVDLPAVRRAVESLGVSYVPATGTPVGADGLHPTSYQKWAAEIAKVVSA